MTENKKLYCSSTLTDHDEIDGDFVGGDWRRVSSCLENIRPFIGGRHAHAKFIREQFMDYFENFDLNLRRVTKESWYKTYKGANVLLIETS